MPTLEFDGKTHIQTHYLTVPHRSIDAVPEKSVAADPSGGRPDKENLIIHGDNLHALKALLPRYAGRVKCVYIDPPYNTGSQAWVYNDNVNSPLMQQWLKENSPVDGEDLERHDKWLCMMWPRLQLLRDLLSDDGVIFVSIDDHEQWRLLSMLEEIFGEQNFIATLIYVQNLGARPGKWMSQVTEYVHVFAKKSEDVTLAPLDSGEEPESDWEKDDKGYYKEGYPLMRTGTGARREDRPEMFFPIYIGSDNSINVERLSEDDTVVLPRRPDGTDARWMWGKEKVTASSEDLLIKRLQNGNVSIITKVRPNLGDRFTRKPRSLWYKPEYAASNGTNMIRKIFDGQRVFDFPKSVAFISDLLRFANVGPDDIVLDSFAGSGTTAHAVLALNKEYGGNRQFILVECEDYADRITAERVRRIIKGVPSAKDKTLREGLGGSFTYCDLGEPLSIEGMLSGKALPSYESLARYLLYTASGVSASGALQPQNEDGLFYQDEAEDYYLLYEPDLEYLRGNDARLNLERAERIHETGRKAVVFGIDKFMGQRKLTTMGITFCQLPYCISSSLT